LGAGLGAAISSSLGLPRIARAQGTRTLRFVPQADAAVLDPMITTGLVNRNHGFLVFDTLYGVDENLQPQPQMAAGHVLEDGGKIWVMTLREGLKFHDGQPVRGRDVVASLKRWASRDALGNSLFKIVNEISAPDDRTVRWRLKTPFPLLPEALGKVGAIIVFIMPERLAQTDSVMPVKELVGSGPFRFEADEHVPGARLVYQRFDGYVPSRMARRACSPGRRSRISIASNGRSCPIPPQRPRPCSVARSTGGTSRSSIFSPLCAPTRR
jgi:peptide/nickel transport system substrate-binding protein